MYTNHKKNAHSYTSESKRNGTTLQHSPTRAKLLGTGLAETLENKLLEPFDGDFDALLKRGYIRVLIPFSKTGYFIIKNSNVHLIADVGNVGPDYLPGHAHADTLSFELFLNDKRFIVNSGISTYENNNIRKQQRSTSYHNTLEINDLNS